jgi:cell division protein FtsI (penicillin-binding protein 3)
VAGSDIMLTIDRDIQWEAQQAIAAQVKRTGAQSGTVVVMDPRTGQVLALATAPGFDPSHIAGANPADLGDRPASEVYEPGSTNKVITFAAGLQTHEITPLTPVTVPPTLHLAGHTFHDAERHGTEHLTAAGVLAKSSNIGTILVSERVGAERLYRIMRAFGFGAPSEVGLPGESAGILPPVDKWSGSQRYTIPFGQGVSVTALQVASVYATVANNGIRVPPRIVQATVDPSGDVHPAPAPPVHRVISPQVAQQLRTMLEAVTTNEGTAPAARIPGYRVAGKTGTSQRVDPACGCYRGYTASFVGFAPADNPQLLVEVVLQAPRRGHYGGAIAAPVFHDVMSFALQSRHIAPTGTKPPKLRLTFA